MSMSPQKKMKKRKELNALIGLSDSSRKKSKQTCGHRLLRTEPPDTASESSSEDQEFNSRSGIGSVRCCSICYPLCVFVILAACVVACAGLIWMQIALKQDLDSLKEKIRIMETSQKLSSNEILKLNDDLKERQRKLDDIESGDRSLSKLWSNLTEINQKLSSLDSALNHLKANIKSASDLISLPRAVEELQKSVATIGSTLTSVQHDVTLIQSDVEERGKEQIGSKDEGQTAHNTQESNSTCNNLKQDIQYVQDDLNELNGTQGLHQSWSSEQIQNIHVLLSNLTRRVSGLEQSFTTDRDHLTTLHTEDDSGNPGHSASRRPRFLSQKRIKRGRRLFPGINSVEDLEKLLHQLVPSRESSGVTYEELKEVLGSDTPDSSLLRLYDQNGDHVYTLDELQTAISA